MKELQERLWKWQVEQFGAVKPFWLSLGVAEEVGELAHCLLKRHQKIRAAANGDMRDKIADAVADIAIYALNLMSSYGLKYDDSPMGINGIHRSHGFTVIHKAAHLLLDREMPNPKDFLVLWSALRSFCATEGIDFEATVKAVAEDVMKRDWKNNPSGEGYGDA